MRLKQFTVQLCFTLQHIHRTFLMLIRNQQRRGRLHLYLGVQGGRQYRHRRLEAEPIARDHTDLHAQVVTHWQARCRVMAVMSRPGLVVLG